MSFATDYLAQLEAFAAESRPTRIRALHLPPIRPNRDNRGEFCALELEDGSLGLSYVLLDDTLARLSREIDNLGLAGTDPVAVARRYAGDGGLWRTIGFASANALTRHLIDRAGFRPDASTDSMGQMNPRPDDHIGMIGLFTPLVGRILATGARLTVIELKAELVGDRDGYRVTLDLEALADCTKVISTSTLLLNDTHIRDDEISRNQNNAAAWLGIRIMPSTNSHLSSTNAPANSLHCRRLPSRSMTTGPTPVTNVVNDAASRCWLRPGPAAGPARSILPTRDSCSAPPTRALRAHRARRNIRS